MLEKVRKYVEKWKMLSSEDGVIVGVSGGADSICLLLLLLELREEIGFDIVAVHVNHGIRGEEANADEKFVRKFCEKRNISLEVYSVEVERIAKERKQSVEEAGREIRRECFEQTRMKYNGTKIALAHHQNDNAETFLFRLSRGTGLKGLGGMAPVKGEYIRPLLCMNRDEIENYLAVQEIAYCTDRTNKNDIYARNYIRNQVIPRMEQGINRKTVAHIHRTMEQLQQIQQYLEEQVASCVEQCTKLWPNGVLVEAENYRNIPEVIRSFVIKELLVRISGKEKDLEEIHVNQINELFEKQCGRKIDLPYQLEAKRIYEGVVITRTFETKKECEEVFFDLRDKEATFNWGESQIRCRVMNKFTIYGETLEKSHTKCFDCDIIKNGISFRTRRQGDYITIHPDGRRQKLKSFFINEKIPQEERDKILLVADGSHILWIVGYRASCAYQTNENTKCVVEVHIDEGEENGRDN